MILLNIFAEYMHEIQYEGTLVLDISYMFRNAYKFSKLVTKLTN